MTTTEAGSASESMLFDALEGLERGDVKPWVDMFRDDGVMEFLFAPPGYPSRLDGKAAIAECMRTYPDHLSIERVVRSGVYHCGNVTVAEFACDATAVAGGNTFRMDYVGLLTVVDGKVKLYRDYWNPLVAIRAMGGLDALLAVAGEGQAS
jgi:ketosteroid isomerase-like protein